MLMAATRETLPLSKLNFQLFYAQKNKKFKKESEQEGQRE